jgi:hypothetical protein
MAKSISVITKKRRGRPVTTGKGTLIGVRLLDDPLAALDGWIAEQKEPDLTRPEAIRRLIEIGLSRPTDAPKKPRVLSTAKQGAARAAELAGKTIDKRLDPAASEEERKVRKRKLVEGPSAFRSTRKDSPSK